MIRTALVVGGASGIGAATAEALARDGFAVAVADLAHDAAVAVVGRLPAAEHRAYTCDISDEESLANLFHDIESQLGPVSVLVVAAGTPGFMDGARPTLKATSLDSWDRVMAVNARGPFLCIREMLRRRQEKQVEHGRIVLIASMSAQNFDPISPPSYVSSKGAVFGLTKVAAYEAAGQGITVNAVSPGPIDTPMLRSFGSPESTAAFLEKSIAGRAGRPDEIAAAVSFLASPSASYINGACIDVNGGLLMR